ncbi:MAG: tetratricopeptide repeat protein [Vicinamibacterales bacterium]
MRLPFITTIVLLVNCTFAVAQDSPTHRIPVVPNEVLSRPVVLRTGIGPAHDTVGTRSKEAQAFYDQGLSYLHDYVWVEAARSFNQALRLDPKLALAHVGLSFVYTEINRPDASRDAFAAAQRLAPELNAHDRAHVDARALQMASEAAPFDLDKRMAYRRALDAALTAFPDDAELWMQRGIAESSDPFERGQGSVVSAIPFYEKALAKGGVCAHHYLAHAYENSNQFSKAVEHATAYAQAAQNVPHAHHMRGHVLRRTGQIAAAVSAFDAADRLQAAYETAERIPPEFEWHHEHNLDLLGSSYQYIGQMARAEKALKAAFDVPSLLAVQMYDKRGWPEFLIGRGRLDEAMAAARILATHPVTIVRATGHIEIARVHLAAGRFAQAADETNLALRELRAASTGQALVAPALQHLQGEFFLRTGQRERGRQMLRDVARVVRALPGPDNWVQALFTLESMARTARAAGDDEFAQWAAMQMIEHDPNYAGGHYAMALSARQRGDSATAQREFATALQLWGGADPSLAEISEIRSMQGSLRR